MNKLLLFCMIPVLAACQSVQPYVNAYLNDLNQKLQQNIEGLQTESASNTEPKNTEPEIVKDEANALPEKVSHKKSGGSAELNPSDIAKLIADNRLPKAKSMWKLLPECRKQFSLQYSLLEKDGRPERKNILMNWLLIADELHRSKQNNGLIDTFTAQKLENVCKKTNVTLVDTAAKQFGLNLSQIRKMQNRSEFIDVKF